MPEQDIDLVIFDCDGVLVDSEILAFQVEAAAFAEIGIRLSAEDLLGRFLGTSSATIFATIEREHGVKLPADFAERASARLLGAYDTQLRAIPGIADLVASLAMPKCVASSSDPRRIRHSLEVTGMLRHFEPHIFSATMVKRGKPAPDLFLHAAENMATPPARCLVIEDSVAGITAARAAGMTVLGFTGGSHCLPGHGEKLRAAGAENVLESVYQLGSHIDRARGLAISHGSTERPT